MQITALYFKSFKPRILNPSNHQLPYSCTESKSKNNKGFKTTQTEVQPHHFPHSPNSCSCHTSCHSVCERAGREKEAIKPWSASFPSLRHISLLTGLFLHAEQGGAALGGGWWKGPPEQTQCGTRQPGWPGPARFMALSHSFPTVRPLSGASGCIIPSLLLFVTSVYLSFLSLSCSTFPIPSFFFNACRLSLSFLFFSILVSSTALFLFSQTSWPAAHSDRVSTTLHVSRVAAPEVCPIACSAELFLNTFVSSLRSIHDLDSTTACFLQNHPHTLHRGCLLEVVLQNAYWMNTKTMYCAIHKHTIH